LRSGDNPLALPRSDFGAFVCQNVALREDHNVSSHAAGELRGIASEFDPALGQPCEIS
jgi:hypothetical protein